MKRSSITPLSAVKTIHKNIPSGSYISFCKVVRSCMYQEYRMQLYDTTAPIAPDKKFLLAAQTSGHGTLNY